MKKIFLIALFVSAGYFVFAQSGAATDIRGKPDSLPIENKGLTVLEFAESVKADAGAEIPVRIYDVLTTENQQLIMKALFTLYKAGGQSIFLDLSDCTFDDEGNVIDFFHIRNVKKCILPLSTKQLNNFDCGDLEDIVLPDGLKTIRHSAFFDAKKLQSIAIPKSVDYIGACAFGDCDALKYIKLDKDADTKNWSPAWNAWNNAEIRYDDFFEEKPAVENNNTIEFDHKVYHLFSDINFKIQLAERPKKSQKAQLVFYDEHNMNSELGAFEIKIKKNKTAYTFKEVSTRSVGWERTDLFEAIFNECEDYWVKLKCSIVFNDGSEIDLNGSARLYFGGF